MCERAPKHKTTKKHSRKGAAPERWCDQRADRNTYTPARAHFGRLFSVKVHIESTRNSFCVFSPKQFGMSGGFASRIKACARSHLLLGVPALSLPGVRMPVHVPTAVLSGRNRVRRKGFVGTRVAAPAFSYLREIETGNERMVDQNSASWNQILPWLNRLDNLRLA